MRILVTGGAGFIGSNLVRRLLDDGDVVTVLDDLSTGYAANIEGLPIRLVKGSILDPEPLSQAMDGTEAVIHLGALGSVPRSVRDPIASHAANATGTLMVLEAAREQCAYVTAASSSSVYGSVPDLPRVEDLATRPLSPYAASKLATEAYVLAYATSYGMSTLPFRFFNVYGPRQRAGHAYAAVIPSFIHAALAGEALPLHGDGTQSRDFTFVDTVTWVLAEAAHNRIASSTPVNLAIGANVSLLDLIRDLERMLGRSLRIKHEPARTGDVAASQARPTRLLELFPHVPQVPFSEGLEQTLDWFRRLEAAEHS